MNKNMSVFFNAFIARLFSNEADDNGRNLGNNIKYGTSSVGGSGESKSKRKMRIMSRRRNRRK